MVAGVRIVNGTPVSLDTRCTPNEVYIYVAYKRRYSDPAASAVAAIEPSCIGDFEVVTSSLGHPIARENEEEDAMYGGSVAVLPEMVREINRYFRAQISRGVIESYRVEIETEEGPLAMGIVT